MTVNIVTIIEHVTIQYHVFLKQYIYTNYVFFTRFYYFTVTNKYVLPASTTVVIGTFKTHRNPKYYRDPDVFNPDNFLPENTQSRPYYSFIPFSAGPRSCVGKLFYFDELWVILPKALETFGFLKLQVIYLPYLYVCSGPRTS